VTAKRWRRSPVEATIRGMLRVLLHESTRANNAEARPNSGKLSELIETAEAVSVYPEGAWGFDDLAATIARKEFGMA
jgi:hypothetical protein